MTELDEYSKLMPRNQIDSALAHYDLPPIAAMEPGTGTASPKIILSTAEGRFLLKRRREEFSAPDVVAFDHSVLKHLRDHGLPVACPLLTRDGDTSVFLEKWAFEVTPFFDRLEPFRQDNEAHVRAAARVLGRLHQCTADFQPAGHKDWPREFHAGNNARTLSQHLGRWERTGPADGSLATARRMLTLLEEAADYLTDDRVAALPQTIIHGDYTGANVFFKGDDVAAILDFDWTCRESRLDDLARAILFFACRRRQPIEDGSIWSLVQAWQADSHLAGVFLASYGEHIQLTADERSALPWFMREVALSMRVRAMRKVPDDRKLAILTFDMNPVLDRLENDAMTQKTA